MMSDDEQKRPANREPARGRTGRSAPSTPLKAAEQQTPPPPDFLNPIPKVPSGNSPYVKAKHVQLVDKDPNRAISLFWAAINSRDRVNSALKDMAIVMKQVGRAEEAVEAIKSFRYLCSADAQESLDNVLLDLYKRCGRMDEQIELLEHKLKLIEEGLVFGGKKTKIARSQGKKFLLSLDQERSRLLGNLAWAHLQKGKFQTAEALYRKALSIAPDKNKQCNLAICLMQTGKISEAKSLLDRIQRSTSHIGPESYMKSFEVASKMLSGLECQLMQEEVETISSSTPGSRKGHSHDDNNAIETASQEFMSRNMRQTNDGEEETTSSPPFTKKNLTSEVSKDQNHDHESQIFAAGQSHWQNDSAKQLFVSAENDYYRMSSAFPTSNNESLTLRASGWAGDNEAQINAETYSWVMNNGIEKEGLTDEKLNSIPPASFPTIKWSADSTPVPLRQNLQSLIQVPTTMISESAINQNWKGRDDVFRVRTQESLKHPPEVLSRRQSPIQERELRWRTYYLPVFIQEDQGPGMSPGEDRRTNPCRQSQPILIGNLRAGTAFQKPSNSVSHKELYCANEKWSIKFGDLDPAVPMGSAAIPNQKTVGHKNQADGSPGSKKGWANEVDEKEAETLPSSSIIENTKAAHNFSAFSCGKTWAQMVEEEEEALAISNLWLNEDVTQTDTMSKESLNWNEKDGFPDENLNFNIVQNSPCQAVWSPMMLETPPQKRQSLLQGYTNVSQWKLEKPTCNYPSKQRKNLFSTGREQNPSARRCLSFEPEQKKESAPDPSPASTKVVDVDDYSYLQAIGSGSKRQGNRLRVFQEITPSDSPRA